MQKYGGGDVGSRGGCTKRHCPDSKPYTHPLAGSG
jgi:hypothetical protein